MATPDPPPWPAAQAQTIRDAATKVGEFRAIALVDQLEDWLGDPKAVVDVTRQWSPVATGHVVDSATDLGYATNNLPRFWEGPGADGFVTYSGQLKSYVDATRIPIQQVADALRDSLDIIKQAYVDAVRLVSDFAIQIVEAAKSVPNIVFGIVDVVTRNPLTVVEGVRNVVNGATGAVLSVVQGFIGAAEKLTTHYISTLFDQTKVMQRLESAASIVQLPERAPIGLGEPDSWEVRRASSYDSPVPDTLESPVPTEPGAPDAPGPDDGSPRAPGSKPPQADVPGPDHGPPGGGGGSESKPPRIDVPGPDFGPPGADGVPEPPRIDVPAPSDGPPGIGGMPDSEPPGVDVPGLDGGSPGVGVPDSELHRSDVPGLDFGPPEADGVPEPKPRWPGAVPGFRVN